MIRFLCAWALARIGVFDWFPGLEWRGRFRLPWAPWRWANQLPRPYHLVHRPGWGCVPQQPHPTRQCRSARPTAVREPQAVT